jgi:plasmid stability protein
MNTEPKRLRLCKQHKQEERQSHYEPHNCDHCKLERELAEAREQIKNLDVTITAALNSANASHFRAIEYQSQRDMLAEALEDYELGYTDGELARLATCETGLGEISPADANREIRRRQALVAVKGGSHE